MDCREALEALLADGERTLGCASTGRTGSWLITTTALYSDLDAVQVVIEPLNENLVLVSDGGMTLLRLDMQGAPFNTEARRKRVRRIVTSFNADVVDDVVQVAVPPQQLAGAVHRIASASVQVDSLMHDEAWKRYPFADRVADWLKQASPAPVELKATLPGTAYSATAAVRGRLSVYIMAVTGTDVTARRTGLQAAGWQLESATSLRPEQRLVLLEDRLERYPSPDIERVLEFGLVGLWLDRVALSEYLASVNSDSAASPMQSRLLLTAGKLPDI